MDKLFDSKVFKVAIYTVVIISLLFVSVNNAFAGDAEAKKYTYDSIIAEKDVIQPYVSDVRNILLIK